LETTLINRSARITHSPFWSGRSLRRVRGIIPQPTTPVNTRRITVTSDDVRPADLAPDR